MNFKIDLKKVGWFLNSLRPAHVTTPLYFLNDESLVIGTYLSFFTELAFTFAFSNRVGQWTKGQEISQANFLFLFLPKNQRNIFLISAGASKMGQIKKINLDTNSTPLSFWICITFTLDKVRIFWEGHKIWKNLQL